MKTRAGRKGLIRPAVASSSGDVLMRMQTGRMAPTGHSKRLKRFRKQGRRGGAAFRRGAKA